MPSIDNLNSGEVRDLLRRVNALEKSSGLGNASISNGAQIVKDASGFVRVRVGKLESVPGEYGLEALVDGRLVPLASIAAAPPAVTVEPIVNLSAGPGASTGWLGSETIEVRTFTGNLDITMGGLLEVAGNKASVFYGYEIRNAAGALVVPANARKAYRCTYTGAGMGAFAGASRLMSETLPPGTYRVTGKHMLQSGAGENSNGSIEFRTLSVKGY